MQKITLALTLATALLSQSIFAGTQPMNNVDSKACSSIANACIKAGYDNNEMSDKNIWVNCMRPVILGQAVAGITVDADTVKTCRTDKISNLKKELSDFQNASMKKANQS